MDREMNGWLDRGMQGLIEPTPTANVTAEEAAPNPADREKV